MKNALPLVFILAIVALFSCQYQSADRKISDGVEADSAKALNRQLALNVLAAIDKNDFNKLEQYLADNFSFSGPSIKVPLNREEFYKSVKEHFAAFPDWHHSVDEMLFDNSKVFLRVTRKGTHKGEFIGLKPTNIEITNSACYVMTIDKTKVLNCWALEDRLGVVKALGIELKRPDQKTN